MLETIYLEVDNVLTQDGAVRPHVKEFLTCIHSRFNVYFLTRLSHENHQEVLSHFENHTSDKELLDVVARIPLKQWEVIRADGINRNEKHVWYNDGLFGEKEETYLTNLGMGYGRKVAETPDFFVKEVAIFEQMF